MSYKDFKADGFRVRMPPMKYVADVVIYKIRDKAVAETARGEIIAESEDHAEVIQEAINHSREKSKQYSITFGGITIETGASVYLLPGTYNIDQPIELNRGDVIYGLNPVTTRLRATTDIDTIIALRHFWQGGGFGTIKGIMLDCNEKARHGIFTVDDDGCSQLTLEDIVVTKAKEEGICLTNGAGGYVEQNRFYNVISTDNGLDGIYLQDKANHNVLIAVIADKNGRDGIAIAPDGNAYDTFIAVAKASLNARYGYHIGTGVFGWGLYAENNGVKDFYFTCWKSFIASATSSQNTIGRKDDSVGFGIYDGRRWLMTEQVFRLPFFDDPAGTDQTLSDVKDVLAFRRNWAVRMYLTRYADSENPFEPDSDKLASIGGIHRRWGDMYVAGKIKYIYPIVSGVVSVPAGGKHVVARFTVPSGKTLVIHSVGELYDPDGYIVGEVYNVTDATSVTGDIDGFDDTGWEVSEGKEVEFRLKNSDTANAHNGNYGFLVSLI